MTLVDSIVEITRRAPVHTIGGPRLHTIPHGSSEKRVESDTMGEVLVPMDRLRTCLQWYRFVCCL
jgi:hypothetical protein